MDIVAQMQDTAIQAVLGPTFEAFVPLLEPKRAEITQARKTFRYGATERHQLDVYSPTTGNNHPILFFVYGGGFVTGERTLPAPADLCYGNLGLYFAQKGFVVVIPDYRLAPGTTFPGPVEDVRDALAWATSDANRAALGANADTNSVFFLGHSAGGVHALTLLLHAPVLAGAPALRARIKGAVIASAPLHFETGIPAVLTDAYYGSAESTAAHAPFSLLRAAPPELLAGLPPLALVLCEHDPASFTVVAADFDAAVAEKDLKPTPVHVFAKGHNHVSFTLALGTGDGYGEKWAEEVVAWIRSL